jgi:diguanylate cyclase (GGDEF)-like protein
MGGDEFIGICGRITAPRDAALVAEKIIACFAEPFLLQGRACAVGASIGISVYPNDGDDVEVLVHKADTAMYRVKKAGKGGYAFFSEV